NGITEKSSERMVLIRLETRQKPSLFGRRGRRYSLTLHSALVGARDAHIFPVLRDRAASDLDALSLEDAGDLLVRQRPGGIFFLDELLDPALQDQQRSAATLRAVHAFGEEVT